MTIFRPSGINEWMECTAPLKFISDRIVHPTAAEGTRIHEYAESILNGEIPNIDLNSEQKLIAKNYIEFVNEYKKYNTTFKVEAPVEVLVVENLICRGTADFVCTHTYDIDDRVLTVIDLKTGRNKCSELQIKTYLAGLAQSKEYWTEIDRAVGIYFYGRTNEYTEYNYTLDELEDHLGMIEDIMIEYSKGIIRHKAGNHCTFCHLNTKCSVLKEHIEKIDLYKAPINLLAYEAQYIEMKNYNNTTNQILDAIKIKLIENKDELMVVKHREQNRNVVGDEAVEGMKELIKGGNLEILEELKPSVATCKKYKLPMEKSKTDMIIM